MVLGNFLTYVWTLYPTNSPIAVFSNSLYCIAFTVNTTEQSFTSESYYRNKVLLRKVIIYYY